MYVHGIENWFLEATQNTWFFDEEDFVEDLQHTFSDVLLRNSKGKPLGKPNDFIFSFIYIRERP